MKPAIRKPTGQFRQGKKQCRDADDAERPGQEKEVDHFDDVILAGDTGFNGQDPDKGVAESDDQPFQEFCPPEEGQGRADQGEKP